MPLRRNLLALAFGLTIAGPALAFGDPIASFDASRLSDHVKTLSSDEFEGRGPGTPAETKTVNYIVEHFKAAGLEPAGDMVNGSRGWTQAVPMMKADIAGDPLVRLNTDDGPNRLDQGNQIVVRAPLNGARSIDLENVPLLFVGYGVAASERNWDDFKGVDVKGMVIVVLSNDPDFEGGEGDFGGKAMTYYGRWTYKYEEAARRGAKGVIVVHEDDASGYGWKTVVNSVSDTQFDINSPEAKAGHAELEGWINGDLASKLFATSGFSFDEAKAMARARDFMPVLLNADLTIQLRARVETIHSSNVIGRFPEAKYPDETIIYTAHWDHLGVGPPDSTGDRIYNGANDNAVGVAQLLEQARAFGGGPPTDRSVIFLATTGEEVGLLGAEYYVSHPIFPIGKTVAVLDTDGGQLWGKARNYSVSGNPKTELVDLLIEEGQKQGRSYTTDPHPEAGNYYRSDPFAFAKAGIPAFTMEGGKDLLRGGTERGEALARKYIEDNYHQPSDEWSPDWDFSGLADDCLMLHRLGRTLADSAKWPEWREGSEFKRIRDLTAQDRRSN